MKAMVMKRVAALAATAEDALGPARRRLGVLPAWRKRSAASPVAEPPEEKAEDPSALQPSIYRIILRYSLRQQLMLFPLSYFQKNSSAQVIPMITAECESLGGFVGEAVATPAFQGGQLLTNIFFMFMQDPVLGLAAVVLYPIQGYIIPKLQDKVNQLGRRRVRTVRQVADRVQESATGVVDILANDTAKLQLTGFAHLLGTIYDIRFEI